MNVFALELNRRLGKRNVFAVACNPGAVASDIWLHGFFPWPLEWVVLPLIRLLFLTPRQGCATSVFSATAPASVLGRRRDVYVSPYWSPDFASSHLFDVAGPFVGANVMQARLPPDVRASGEALWRLCGRMTASGVRRAQFVCPR